MNIDLLKIIDHEVFGVFWLTKSPLSASLKHYHEFDYLLNGLLTDFISERETSVNDKNFFSTTAFDRHFFVGHICLENKPRENILDILSLVAPVKNHSENILIIQEKAIHLASTLKNHKKQFHFNEITI